MESKYNENSLALAKTYFQLSNVFTVHGSGNEDGSFQYKSGKQRPTSLRTARVTNPRWQHLSKRTVAHSVNWRFPREFLKHACKARQYICGVTKQSWASAFSTIRNAIRSASSLLLGSALGGGWAQVLRTAV